MQLTNHLLLLGLLSFSQLAWGNSNIFFASDSSQCNNSNATAQCLIPKFQSQYYADQGIKYFKTMQSSIPIWVKPKYAPMVVRWEWPPWLLLTGYTKPALIWSDIFLKITPTKYNKLDCKSFTEQPFCRCHVVFNYSGYTVPIYEEFTFNDKGQITFIEAWSDYPSLLPMNPDSGKVWTEQSYWAMNGARRLSIILPGLGNKDGRIDLYSDATLNLAKKDKDIADLLERAKRPIYFWFMQLFKHTKELKASLDVPVGDTYPYYQP